MQDHTTKLTVVDHVSLAKLFAMVVVDPAPVQTHV